MDGLGNFWSGHGRAPRWFNEAIASGKTKSDLAAKGAGFQRPANASSKVKYTDGKGNSWSGLGPQPKWIKEAIQAGHSLDDLRAG